MRLDSCKIRTALFMERSHMTNDFDLAATRRDLIALRVKHGADTPTGHRCSNLLEQLENRAKSTDADWRAPDCNCLPWPGKCPYCGGDAPVPNGERA